MKKTKMKKPKQKTKSHSRFVGTPDEFEFVGHISGDDKTKVAKRKRKRKEPQVHFLQDLENGILCAILYED